MIAAPRVWVARVDRARIAVVTRAFEDAPFDRIASLSVTTESVPGGVNTLSVHADILGTVDSIVLTVAALRI